MQGTYLVLKFPGFGISNRNIIADVENAVKGQTQLSELDDIRNAGVCQLLEPSKLVTASRNFDSFHLLITIITAVIR